MSNSIESLKHFCFFETASLGASYKLSQMLASTLPHKIFEASVTPSGSILVIAFEVAVQKDQIKQWIGSEASVADSVKSLHLSLNTSRELIDGYLNQIMRPVTGTLVLVEGHLFSAVLPVVESLLSQGLQIVEFRLLRSHHNQFCVSFTASSASGLEQKIMQAKSLVNQEVHVNLISSPSEEIINQYAF